MGVIYGSTLAEVVQAGTASSASARCPTFWRVESIPQVVVLPAIDSSFQPEPIGDAKLILSRAAAQRVNAWGQCASGGWGLRQRHFVHAGGHESPKPIAISRIIDCRRAQ